MTQKWNSLALGHAKAEVLGDIPLGLDNATRPDWDQVYQLYRMIRYGPNQQTIAITGGWGSGKTSLMRLVQHRLDTEKGLPTVWFNAWRYEREPELVVPLLLTIDQELRKADWLEKGILSEARTGLRKLSIGMLRGLTLRTGPIQFSGKDTIDFIQADHGEEETDASMYFGFVARLEELVKKLGGNTEEFRIVIFIDDLDRCQSTTMFRLMESMKLFFDIPGVVFVVGVAIAPLRQAVAEHYSESIDSLELTRADEYVDKIFPGRVKVFVPVSPLLDEYGRLTECLFLNEPSELIEGQPEISGAVYQDLLLSILRYWDLRSPRVAKMWLGALDLFAHRYVLLRRVKPDLPEWEGSFNTPEMAFAIEGLATLTNTLALDPAKEGSGRLSIEGMTIAGSSKLQNTLALIEETGAFGDRLESFFNCYPLFAQPSTLVYKPEIVPFPATVSTDQQPPPSRVIRP